MNSRRLRVVYIDERAILGLFAALKSRQEYLELPVLDGLADGYELSHVIHEPMRRAFGFIISHPSFTEVEYGNLTPELQTPRSICFKRTMPDEATYCYFATREKLTP